MRRQDVCEQTTHIYGELYAQNNKLLLREAPSYGGVCTFKDVYPSSVRLTRTHARNRIETKKAKIEKEKRERTKVCVRT